MTHTLHAVATLIFVGLLGACTGCEPVPGFTGKARLPSGHTYDAGTQLRSFNSFEEPLAHGRRLIVLDLYEPNDHIPSFLVLMIRSPRSGWATVKIPQADVDAKSDADSEAWPIDPHVALAQARPAPAPPATTQPDQLTSCAKQFFEAFAACSPAQRAATPGVSRLTGVVELGADPVDVDGRFAVRVTLSSTFPPTTLDGWFATSIVPQPDRLLMTPALTAYLLSGGPPL